MDEGLYRQHQAVARLFGPAATISGSIGTRKAPGELRIIVAGETIGTGASFGQALQAASTALTIATRGTARSPRIVSAC